jgi:hypothetical protein
VNVWPKRLSAPKGVFAASYSHGTSELLAYVNITDEAQHAERDVSRFGEYRTVLQRGEVQASDTALHLGPYAAIWLEK